MKTIDEYKDMYTIVRSQMKAISVHGGDDDASLSDDEYFIRGLYSDILMNAESILANIIVDNRNTQGIDSSARAILEAFLILDKNKKGEIEPEQKTLYRLGRFPVEYYNRRSIFDQMLDCGIPTFSSNNDILSRESKIKEFCKLASHFHGAKIDKNNPNIRYADFYLRKRGEPNSYINYSDDLINNYKTNIENQKYTYHFFSQMIHPWFEQDDDKLAKIMEERNKLVENVLNRVMSFIDDELAPASVIVTFDELYNIDPKIDNDKMLNDFQVVFDFLAINYSALYGIPPFFFKRIGYLVQDIYLLYQLGSISMEITKFKCITEMVSVLSLLTMIKSKEERDYRIKGFCLSSRLRLIKSKNEDIKLKDIRMNYSDTFNDLQDIYAEFYHDNYSYKTNPNKLSQDFFNHMKTKGFYPLEKCGDTISSFVSTHLNQRFNAYGFYDEFYNTYIVALKMEHGIGCAYNTSFMTLQHDGLFAAELCLGIFRVFYDALNCRIETYEGFIKYFANECVDFRKHHINESYIITTGHNAPKYAYQPFELDKYLLGI